MTSILFFFYATLQPCGPLTLRTTILGFLVADERVILGFSEAPQALEGYEYGGEHCHVHAMRYDTSLP